MFVVRGDIMGEQKSVAGYVELRLDPKDSRSEFRPLTYRTTSGAAVDDLPPWHGRALRIALAMKGGLSLAVWIGGAIAELDVLRRIRIYRDENRPRALLLHIGHSEDVHGESAPLIARAEQYARFLATRGYDHIEFDVLAGASAGGLNGVLYATAQRAGVGFDSILDTWVTTGSAWGLLQTGRPAVYHSIMRGDTYFWPEVATAVDTIARNKTSCPQMRASQVVVDLSATLIDAVDSSDRATSEGRAQFRFVGDDRDEIRDRAIPERQHEDYTRNVARIAYAARTTSSFPAMFEPALIYSGTTELGQEHGWEQPEEAGYDRAVGAPDMRMVFNAHRADATTHPFRVVDGGLFDNIPIDRALNAVRDLPAEEHINRAIIYLDPSPKETASLFRRPTAYDAARPTLTRRKEKGTRRFVPEEEAARTDVASRLVASTMAALRKRAARESRDEEIEEVDRVRAAISVVKARNELLAIRMDGSPPSRTKAQAAERAYVIYRATSDLELLTPALLHPGEWLLGTDLAERPELVAVDRIGILHVETAFRQMGDDAQEERYCAPGLPGATLDGRQSLVDACLTTLSWIRSIENTAFQEGVLGLLDEAIGRQHRAKIRADLNGLMGRARRARDAAILSTVKRIQPSIRGRSLTADGATELCGMWVRDDSAPSAELAKGWSELDAIVDQLFDISGILASADPTSARWGRTPWSQLRRTAGPRGFARDLPLIFGGNGIPQPISSVRFHRIGSDIKPANSTQFRKLLEDQLLRGYRAALARPIEELDAVTVHNYLEESTLRSNAKLAGLRTGNLAGFLSGAWRVNDWWWGRLDASAGIVEFIGALPTAPLKRGNWGNAQEPLGIDLSPHDNVVEEVQDAVLRQLEQAPVSPLPGRPDATSGSASLSDVADIRERMIRGTQGLESLSDAYRTAITSRAIRIASSAISRGTGRASMKRIAHWIVRPIAALAPALVSRPRAILLFGLLVAGALVIWPTAIWPFPERLEPDAVAGASIVASVLIVTLTWSRLAFATWSRRRRRRRILDHTTTKLRTRALIRAAERRALPGRSALAGLTLVAGSGVVGIDLMYGMGTVLYWAWLGAYVLIAGAAVHAAQTVPRTLAHGNRLSTISAALGALVIVVAVIALRLNLDVPAAASVSGLGWWDAVVVAAASQTIWWHAIAAGAAGLGIAFVMLAGCFKRWRMLVMPVLAVALASAAASAAAWTVLTGLEFPAPAGRMVEVLVAGWIAGTVLWWAPWWRGRATRPQDAPSDAVRDLDWRPVIEEKRRRTRAKSRAQAPSPGAFPAPAPAPS
jgi:predicted acylesterase/phospholipase RssA